MLTQALHDLVRTVGGEISERGGEIELTKVLAERRVLLSRRRLVYRARLRVDEGKREVHLSESLTEVGSGLAADGGAGFKVETYRTGRGPREGDLAERSRLFGKVYATTFDHGAVRSAIEGIARQHGYTVCYRVTGR